MPLTAQDRIDIADLLNRHGHLTDAGELERMDELFAPDITFDATDFGFGLLRGLPAIREAALALGEANPVGHHVTNIVITPIDERSARVLSKGIGVGADGSVGSVSYEDLATRRPEGWRIAHRTISARRYPLNRRPTTPRDILDQWRAASTRQSEADLRRLYAADAIHEFPFTAPGLPSRLSGRDAIVDWIAEGWRTGPLVYSRYRTIAVHDTADPATIVAEQEACGTSATTGEFTLPNLLVLTVRDGRIVRLRDYVNLLAASAVMDGDR